MPPDQGRIIEQGKFAYSPLVEAFEKQIKTIKDQDENQIRAIKNKRNNPEKHPDVLRTSPYGPVCNAKGRILSGTSLGHIQTSI